MAILEQLKASRAVLKFDAIAAALNLPSAAEQAALERRLQAMVRDGQLLINRRGGYAVVAKLDLVRGVVIGHPDGYGFLRPERGGDDLYLAPKQMRVALHGDEVLASISGIDRRGRGEAVVVEVLKRANLRVLGRYIDKGRIGFVAADNRKLNQDVYVAEGLSQGAADGELVLVEITEQPTSRSQLAGRVIERLGLKLSPDRLIDVAIAAYGLPPQFPEVVIKAAKRIPEVVRERDMQGRFDLRDTELITIDGEDARDFDDAVYAEPKRGGGWRLLVAIADVSAYVAINDVLDLDARERSTSVYFPKRVVPMLPERLSNGICSLNPAVERLCMVCEMSVSVDGKVTRSRFFSSVMRSHARLTYSRVWALLNKDAQPSSDEKGWLLPRLNALYAMFQAMVKARSERGALEFESKEVKFQIGDDGAISAIEPTTRNAAHRIIEECMIAANVEAAKFLGKHKMPAPYRVHAPPAPTKLHEVQEFLRELGLKLKLDAGGGITPKDFALLLERVRARPDARLIETMLLRAQALAVYQTDNLGILASR
jgi:ribonuclease R